MNRVVVITGASRGLGAAIAMDLAAPGVTLVLGARDAAHLQRTADAVRARGASVVAVAMDVTRSDDRERLIAAAEREGGISALINNAGVECSLPLCEQTPEEIAHQLDVNLHAPIALTRRVLPRMIAAKRGVIVMMSSVAGKSASPFFSVYSATKYGLNGFAESLRFELDGTGVHVGVVCPLFVSGTGMWQVGGVKAPRLMPEISVARVVRGVRRALAGKREVLVTPSPIRPLLAVAALAPSIVHPLTRALGVVRVMERRVARERANRGR